MSTFFEILSTERMNKLLTNVFTKLFLCCILFILRCYENDSIHFIKNFLYHRLIQLIDYRHHFSKFLIGVFLGKFQEVTINSRNETGFNVSFFFFCVFNLKF